MNSRRAPVILRDHAADESTELGVGAGGRVAARSGASRRDRPGGAKQLQWRV
jgi:hypothetical protein